MAFCHAPKSGICREKVQNCHLGFVVSVQLVSCSVEECLMVLVLEFHEVCSLSVCFDIKKAPAVFSNDEC